MRCFVILKICWTPHQKETLMASSKRGVLERGILHLKNEVLWMKRNISMGHFKTLKINK